jgi:RNA polymerase sigma factor (sigma-70 family)
MTVASLSPGALVALAVEGDHLAWNELVARYSRKVYAICRGFRLSTSDAADVTQTVWLRLAEHLDRIREPERVEAWLATCARNECRRLSRMGGRVVLTDDQSEVVDVRTGAPEDRMIGEERVAALRVAFARLPERCQELLTLLTLNDKPNYTDVAARLGRPVGSLGPTRARCLEHLRRELGLSLDGEGL